MSPFVSIALAVKGTDPAPSKPTSMPPLPNVLRLLALATVLALAALACGQAEGPSSRIGDLASEEAGQPIAAGGQDPREGLETGMSGGSDPTKTAGGPGSLTSGVGSGSGGSDPTGTAQDTEGFDGTQSWEMLIAQLGGVLTSTYTVTYAVSGNPAVRSVAVVNLPPRQAVTVQDAFGNRHWALYEDGKPLETCVSYSRAWRCASFDPDDYTKWLSALLTTGFSPTFLAGLLAPGLLAEGPVPSYTVSSETVLGLPATCVTTGKIDTWPGATVCVDSHGVPLTVSNTNLGTVTMTTLSHTADPAGLARPA